MPLQRIRRHAGKIRLQSLTAPKSGLYVRLQALNQAGVARSYLLGKFGSIMTLRAEFASVLPRDFELKLNDVLGWRLALIANSYIVS